MPEEMPINEFGLVLRDQKELLDLPLEFRWEFTRRHPYYLQFWRYVRDYRRNAFEPGSRESDLGQLLLHLLERIGVTGEPADPALSFEQLGDTEPALLSGAVQPMTFRAMIALLLARLPRPELDMLRTLAELAIESDQQEQTKNETSLAREAAHATLAQTNSVFLDSYPEMPLYYVHLEASLNRILDDVGNLVGHLKERRGIPERRTPIAKLPEYLQIWDMREGWKEGTYERTSEMSIRQIADRLHKPKSSVLNAYRAAFKRIIGHEFSKDLWFQTMGRMKLVTFGEVANDEVVERYQRQAANTSVKTVPESTLLSQPVEHGRVGVVEDESATKGDQENIELQLDILTLLERGLTDDEIASRLELPDVGIVSYLRERLADMT